MPPDAEDVYKRQDNALLRELRGQVKKLAQAVKSTLPALAEAMENLRKNLLLFCYQLGYLRKGKERLNTSLNTLRPALTQYNQLAKDIRDKTKERRSLLTEKKALSAVHVFRHRELAAKIAALTEDLDCLLYTSIKTAACPNEPGRPLFLCPETEGFS